MMIVQSVYGKTSSSWMALSCLVLLSGCVGGIGAQPADQTQAKPEDDIKKELYHLTKEVAELKQADERSRTANASLSQRLSTTEGELAKVRGDLERVQNQQRRANEQIATLEKRPVAAATLVAATPAAENVGNSQSPAAMLANQGGAKAANTPDPASADNLLQLANQEKAPETKSPPSYDEAFRLLKANEYDKSLAEFQKFLKARPKDDLSDNAQYWIGELHFVQKRYPEALTAFNQVLVKWPASDKVPPSLLKIGFAFDELGDYENARISLERLVKDFPTSSPVSLAKQRLKTIAEDHPPETRR